MESNRYKPYQRIKYYVFFFCLGAALLGSLQAGLLDPLIGEGIRYAIISARLAAEAIAAGDLAGYEEAVWREIGHSLATAGMVANTYYRLPRLSYQIGLRNPATARHILDILTEKASYEGIGRRLLTAAIGWLFFGDRAGNGAEI